MSAHKITIYDKEINKKVITKESYFIGLDNKVYKLQAGVLLPDDSLYWKFDMIEVKY